MADLFISYSRKDIAYARLLHKTLSEHDLEAWVDWQDIPPSTEWLQEVYAAIEAAHTFIFLLSDSSTISEICNLEIEHARQNNKRIIPIVINEVEPSQVHPALAAINWIFSRSKDELQPAIAALIEAIQTDYEWVKAHTRLQVRALEWERAGQDKSFLLQGTDLRQAEDWLAAAPAKKPEPSLLQSRFIQSSRQAAARRQRSLLTGVGIALVATTVLGVLAFINARLAQQQRQVAEEQRGFAEEQKVIAEEQRGVAVEQARLARVRELTAVSQLPGTRFDIALLLGAEAYNTVDNYQTRSNLLRLTQQHPNVIRTIAHELVRKITLSPDGMILASIDWQEKSAIHLWDASSGQPLGTLLQNDSRNPQRSPGSIKFSPQGKVLACGYSDGEIILWEVARREPIKHGVIHPNGGVFSLAFSPDGKTLASGGTDGTIILWDTASMQSVGQLLEGFYSESEETIVFSPDGRILAYTGVENPNNLSTIILWDIAAEQPIGKFQTENGFIHTLAFSPEGNILASAGEGSRIILWDVEALQPLLEIEREESSGTLSIAFSPNGKTLAAASRNRTIKMYDTSTGQRIGEAFTVHSGEVANVTYHPQEDILVSSSLDGTIIFWDIDEETNNGKQLTEDFVWSREMNVSFSPDGKTLACAHENEIILWDIASGQPLPESLDGENDRVFGVAFSPDGKTLASATVDGTLILWDLASKKPRIGPWTAGIPDQYQGFNNLAFSPDGKVLANVSGHENRMITLWDTSNGGQIGEPLKKENYRYNQCIAISPDGSLLAAGGEGETIMWDLVTGKPIAFLGVHVGWVSNLVFSPDGKILATGAEDGIILWDLANMQPLSQTLRDHQSPVLNLAFSPDGSLLASASYDGEIILWDAVSQAPLGEPLSGAASSEWRSAIIDFSPNGKSLISLHEDGMLSTWDVDVASWHRRVCDRVGRNFTQEEWSEYFPDEPYRKTCPQWPAGN